MTSALAAQAPAPNFVRSIVAEDNRLVMTPSAATCAPNGTVYFMAFVNERGAGPQQAQSVADLVLEKKGRAGGQRGKDYNLRLCIYKPKASRRGDRP